MCVSEREGGERGSVGWEGGGLLCKVIWNVLSYGHANCDSALYLFDVFMNMFDDHSGLAPAFSDVLASLNVPPFPPIAPPGLANTAPGGDYLSQLEPPESRKVL